MLLYFDPETRRRNGELEFSTQTWAVKPLSHPRVLSSEKSKTGPSTTRLVDNIHSVDIETDGRLSPDVQRQHGLSTSKSSSPLVAPHPDHGKRRQSSVSTEDFKNNSATNIQSLFPPLATTTDQVPGSNATSAGDSIDISTTNVFLFGTVRPKSAAGGLFGPSDASSSNDRLAQSPSAASDIICKLIPLSSNRPAQSTPSTGPNMSYFEAPRPKSTAGSLFTTTHSSKNGPAQTASSNSGLFGHLTPSSSNHPIVAPSTNSPNAFSFGTTRPKPPFISSFGSLAPSDNKAITQPTSTTRLSEDTTKPAFGTGSSQSNSLAPFPDQARDQHDRFASTQTSSADDSLFSSNSMPAQNGALFGSGVGHSQSSGLFSSKQTPSSGSTLFSSNSTPAPSGGLFGSSLGLFPNNKSLFSFDATVAQSDGASSRGQADAILNPFVKYRPQWNYEPYQGRTFSIPAEKRPDPTWVKEKTGEEVPQFAAHSPYHHDNQDVVVDQPQSSRTLPKAASGKCRTA